MFVSNFLWNKWGRAFRLIDHNKDGYVTEEDFVANADYVSRKTNANAKEAAITRATWVGWFRRSRPDSSVDKMDMYAYNRGKEKHYLEDPKAYGEKVAHYISDMFDHMDLNKDGYISVDELEVFYGAAGITDQQFIREVFDTIDKNGDGLIERSEYVAAHVQYNTKQEAPDEFEFIWDPSYGRDDGEGFR